MYKFSLPAALVLLLLAAVSSTAASDNLLANPSFEDGGGSTDGWSALSGDLYRVSSSNTGDWGARLTSDGHPAAKMWQNVPVEPLAKYQLSGWALLEDPNLRFVRFRIQWLNSGSGSVGPSDSNELVNGTGEPGTFTMATTHVTEAPASATRALILAIAEGVEGTQFNVYIDDIVFTQVAPPPTPAPTEPATPPPTMAPTPEPSATPALTEGATRTPTRTPSRTPTRTPTANPTPTPIPPITPGPEPNIFSSLANGGFEQSGQDGAFGWRKIGGTVSRSGSRSRSGSFSLALASTTSSTKWAYQTVTVQGGTYYRATAYALQSNTQPGELFLRLSWYASSDGSGESIANDDSTAVIGGNSSSFQLLATGPVQAPSNARTVRVRLMFRPAGVSGATAYFDDVAFSNTSAPTDGPAPTEAPASPPAPTTVGRTPTPRPTSGATNPPGSTQQPDDSTNEPTAFTSLANGSFEEAREDGTPYGWRKVGGSFAVSPANRTSGELGVDLSSDTPSTKWVYQAVQVTPGAYYRASAWALNTLHDDELILRTSWYPTSDGEGSAISDVDSLTAVSGASSGFRQLDSGVIRAPGGAHSARVRLLLRPASAQTTHAFFDDVVFASTSAPQAGSVVGSSGGNEASVGGATQGVSPTDGGVVAGVPTPGTVHNGGPDREEAIATPDPSSGGSDWLLALAIGVPVIGIGGVLGVPYVRRKLGPPSPPAS